MNKELLQELFEYKDGELIWKIKPCKNKNIGEVAGCINKTTGYIQIQINKKVYLAHRLIYIYHKAEIPAGMEIDHINRIKSDNRIENLRLATVSQNISNTTKRKNNKSGYKGVCWDKQQKQWEAQIKHNKKNIHLGLFATAEVASQAYNAAATKLHGEFACME